MHNDYEYFTVSYMHETSEAILVQDENGDKRWIPKSVCDLSDLPRHVQKFNEFEIGIRLDFARKLGWV